jgi:hypothetical protein
MSGQVRGKPWLSYPDEVYVRISRLRMAGKSFVILQSFFVADRFGGICGAPIGRVNRGLVWAKSLRRPRSASYLYRSLTTNLLMAKARSTRVLQNSLTAYRRVVTISLPIADSKNKILPFQDHRAYSIPCNYIMQITVPL